ncbi:MAG: hypothetical protein CL607_09910 [Anaerolineaceae bacterium]|nr:hypothetical protein [Anaerolineaceae bacterium]
MAKDFLLGLTNAIYNVGGAVRRFVEHHPDEQLLAAGAAKARRMSEEQDVMYGVGWMVARRAPVILSDHRLKCGDWDIPLAKIKYAEIMTIRSFISKGFVIKVADDTGNHYQFGVPYDTAWLEQDVLSFKQVESSMSYSLVSIGLRVVVFGYLAIKLMELLT